MRVLIDTNVLFSALVFPASTPARAVERALEKHDVVLCERSLEELDRALRRKSPEDLQRAEDFLSQFRYHELIPPVNGMIVPIRDAQDQPILNAAIAYNVDIILTGDKDFLVLGLHRPRLLTPAQFLINLESAEQA